MTGHSEPRGIAALARAWDHFFFRPADPAPLGLMRIAVGLLLLWSVGCLGLDLAGSLGSEGWADPSIIREARELRADHEGRPLLEWSLWDAVPDGSLRAAWVASMVVLALFAAGFASRVTAPLAWAIAVSTARRNPLILHGFDGVLSLWTFYLAITFSSGAAFSVDRWMKRRRGEGVSGLSVGANLGLRMIQVNLAILYGAAGLAKVRGVSWWDGSALIKILGNAEFRPFDLTWALRHEGSVYLLNLLTHIALWTELLYPFLIWGRATRRPMLAAVALMHVGIALTLGLYEFSLAMLAGNLAFVSGAGLRGLGGRRRRGVESNEAAAPASARPATPPPRPRR